MSLSKPSIEELRQVCQPASTMDRRNGEHWAGRLYMRRISLYLTRVFLALGWSPNQITWLMIDCGIGAAPALLIPGVAGPIVAVVLIQLYLLLDCCDGEVARWTKRTSPTGVYLDRVGHYLTEAALMVGLGFRAAAESGQTFATIGVLAALGVVLIKSETDLVLSARAASGLPAMTDADLVPRSSALSTARKFASMLGYHKILGAVEASLIILGAAIIDAVTGSFAATAVMTVIFAAVAGIQVVLHLVSILSSQRLR